MGYRNYLYKFPKEEYLKIKNKSEKQLSKIFPDSVFVEDDFFSWHNMDKKGLKEIYGFGKYCDFKTEGNSKPVFPKIEDSDGEFLLVEKKFLLHCIDKYRQNVVEYYKSLQEKPIEEIKEALKTKSQYWNGEWVPYNIDEKKEHLVESWEYEHQIFDLVRILKNFDFEKNILIYAGY